MSSRDRILAAESRSGQLFMWIIISMHPSEQTTFSDLPATYYSWLWLSSYLGSNAAVSTCLSATLPQLNF